MKFAEKTSMRSAYPIPHPAQRSGASDRVAPDPVARPSGQAGTRSLSDEPIKLAFHRSHCHAPATGCTRPTADTRPPTNNGLAPTDSGAAASAELIRYLTQDHDRIAQGINDVVVRRIFAAGLDLQAALGLIGEHRGASKIWHATDELDQAVRDIRDTIFDATRPRKGQTPRAHSVDLPA